jgi:adenylate cyclase
MQLRLFSKNVSKSSKIASKRRVKKTLSRGTGNGPGWDLWQQETDCEKEMALLFLDIRNFTPLTEAHLASDIIHIVKKLFASFQHIIRKHHGRIVETSGDGFYAAFGLESNITEAVNGAVQAGMSIIRNLEVLNETSFEKNLNRRIDIGIGVHAGKVATGNMQLGSEEHMIIMGYPVNVASRLQSATKELNNNFIVSSAVFKQLNHPPANKTRVTVNLKGVSEPFELHLIGKPYRPEHQLAA